MMNVSIYAHRGASAQCPENTISAFRKAIEEGADGIELDVHLTKDGIPVVIHDESIDRTSTGSGNVYEMTYAEISKFDFGIKSHRFFINEKIPTLQDVLVLIQPWHGSLNIELKNDQVDYQELEEKVILLIKQLDLQDRIIFSSFNHNSLKKCKKICPDIACCALLERYEKPDLQDLLSCGITALHPDLRDINKKQVKKWHQAGFLIRPYTANHLLLILWLIYCGVDAVITNYPARGMKLSRCFRWI